MKGSASRSLPTVIEETPEYEPQPNGTEERCAQTATGLFNTSRSARENRIGGPGTLTWLVRRSTYLHNRYHVGHAGRTL